jgi:hypothetical protein
MKNGKTSETQTMCRILRIACATALAVAFAVALPQPARAANVTPPRVPQKVEVPSGNTAFLVGHGVGTQNYICLPTGPDSAAYTLFTPEATLFEPEDNTKQLITHFFSPNRTPTERGEKKGTIRVTWQDSQDTSTVWAKLDTNPDGSFASASPSSDPDFVAKGAVNWLRLKAVGAEVGPDGGDTLSDTTFIQRLNTSGGLAPTDCASSADAGKQAFVPYTADYFFYKEDSN